MRTKLIVSIEINETMDETIDLFKMLYEKGECKVSDIFDPEQTVMMQEMGGINAVSGMPTLSYFINRKIPTEPEESNLKLIMFTRK